MNSITQNVKVWLMSLTVVVMAGLLNGAIGVTVFNRVLQGETASQSLVLRTCAVLVQVLGVGVGSMILSRLTRGASRGGDILLKTFFAVMAGLLLFITRGGMLALFWEPGDRPVFADFFKLRAAAVLLAFSVGITAVCIASRYLLPLFRPESRTDAE